MGKSRTLHQVLLRRMLLLVVLAFLGMVVLWVVNARREFASQVEEMRQAYRAERAALVRKEVERALQQINQARETLDADLQMRLRERVDGAHAILSSLHAAGRDRMEPAALQRLLLAALREIRFFHGRGYFFVSSLAGTALLWPIHPGREGTRVWDAQDTEGRYFVRDLAALAREAGGGFYRYTMAKPGETGEGHAKLACIRHFAPFDWYVGTGEYVADFRHDVQASVLERLEATRLKDASYLFGSTYDGVVLLGPGQGRNMLREGSGRARSVVAALIAKARAGGGFVEYVMPALEGQAARPKLSYVLPVQDWGWYIGAGVYVDTIDEVIQERQTAMEASLVAHLGLALLLFAGVTGIAFVAAQHLAGRTRRGVEVFSRLMARAAESGAVIDSQGFEFAEFREFAEQANIMLRSRNESEAQVNKAQWELKKAQALLMAAIENSPAGILIADAPDVTIRVANAAALGIRQAEGSRLTDIPAELHPAAWQVFHPDGAPYRGEDLPLSRAVLKGETVQNEQAVIRNGRGEERLVLVNAAPVRDKDGAITAGVVVFLDITEQQRTEEQLRHSQKMEAIGQLAGGIAHDFNNMLGGIIGAAELLARRLPDDAKAKRYQGIIMESAERAAGLTQQLLAFARRQRSASSVIDVHETIRDTVALLESTIDRRVTIETDLAAAKSFVVGDPSQLQSAFLNLGINAAHAMEGQGNLTIATSLEALDAAACAASTFDLAPGSYIRIAVQDTGCGIAPENLDRIFEPFFTTKEQGQGTGLGLAAVFGTVQQHKGGVAVQSVVGQGATFSILLPLAQAGAAPRVDEQQTVAGTGCVLIVDDEPVMRGAAEAILEGLGYEVVLAADGREGLSIYEADPGRFDLVILDMVMPELNGRDCFAAMQRVNPDVRVVLASGFSAEADVAEMRAAGLSGFIQKPFRSAALSAAVHAAVHAALQRPQQAR